MATPFDPDRLRITGPGRRIAEGVLSDQRGTVHYAVDQEGNLVYRTGEAAAGAEAGHFWVDREGAVQPASEHKVRVTAELWESLALSPDGTRVALSHNEGGDSHVRVQPLAPGAPPRRLTFEGTVNVRPAWTPDGEGLVFVSDRGAEGRTTRLYRVPADGSAEPQLVLAADREVEEGFVSPDGGWLVYRLGGASSSNRDIHARRIGADADTMPVPLAATAANERAPALSPDGRWLAYVTDETGLDEVFVTRFPEGTGKWQVSLRGGTSPVWGPDGELFFISFSNRMTSARYRGDTRSFDVLGYEELFAVDGFITSLTAAAYQVAEDGRFLVIALDSRQGDRVVWVRNWVQEMLASY